MIRGYLLHGGWSGRPGYVEPYHEITRPYVAAVVKIARLGFMQPLLLALDTCSDIPILNLLDAAKHIGLEKYRMLTVTKTVTGVSGAEEFYVEPAHVTFSHEEDGHLEGYEIELYIGRPSLEAMENFRRVIPNPTSFREVVRGAKKLRDATRKELEQKCRFPSLLGTDVLSHFKLTVDWPGGVSFLGASRLGGSGTVVLPP